MNNLVRSAFINALGTVAYVALVAIGMYNGERFFGQEDTVMIPIAMLLLFVLSASVTGSLVLGKPVLMYLDGHKVEAVKLFMYTLGWLALYTLIFLVLNTIK